MSKARQKIYQKLNSIRLESVKFVDVPLQQVLEILVLEVRNRDPEKEGFNFALTPAADPHSSPAARIDPATGLPTTATHAPTGLWYEEIGPGLNTYFKASGAPEIDPATGLPTTSAPGTADDIRAATIRIDPQLDDVTLQQLLDIIVKVADKPLKYSVEDYGVLISPRTAAELPPLQTRWFKIDPNTFMHGLQGVPGLDSQSAGKLRQPGQLHGQEQQGQASLDSLTARNPEEILGATIRAYFRTVGVNLDPPKSIIFKDRLGMLMVRATLADLDVIEQAVQVLNMGPPQVEIEVKFCEVPEELLAAPGLKLHPAITETNGAGTNADSTSLRSVLTPEQARNVIQTLEQIQGVTILATPKVITPTGRQAQIKVVDVRTIVTGLDLTTNTPPAPGQPPEHPPVTKQFEFGPTVDLVPYVAADGRAIQLTVIPSIKEFIGYDVDYAVSKGIWDYVPSPGANPPPGSQIYPLPIFRLRQVVSSATVWDGQTLVLASHTAKIGVPESHIANKLPKELTDQLSASIQRMQKPPEKAMLVFITPRIIDPAGNPVHTDADLPARTNSVPSQPPPALK